MAQGPDPFNLPTYDPAKRAAAGLSAMLDDAPPAEDVVILDEKIKSSIERREVETQLEKEARAREEAEIADLRVDARAARTGDRMLDYASSREGVRLLLFTRDEDIMSADSLAQKRILELAQLFPEIHIVLLTVRRRDQELTARIASNVWVYITNSNYWWRTPFDAYRIAEEQLTFAGGFRADIVLADDPFESAAVAHFIADKYERPFQIHIHEDFYDPIFKEADPHNPLRLYIARYVIPRADCVRTRSAFIRDRIVETYPDLTPYTEVLPVYHNLTTWRDLPPTFSLHERYPQFKFIMLHVTSMQAHSHTERVLNGAAFTLNRYPTVGLVIVGSGPMRAALEKQVISLGIQRQVVFESVQQDIISHMKSANILIHLSESSEEEEIILQAAAAKLPMIAVQAGLAGELFVDGESAFLCPLGDVGCVSSRINAFLNENQARARFALNAYEAVFERIEQDYTAYLRAYTSSIERCAEKAS